MSRKIKIDPVNFNKHSEIGMGLLETSIREVGVIESICIDKKGEIITGNARFETFEKLGYKPKMIELSENEYPVIQTDLEGEKRVKAAILENTTAKRDINLDIDLIQEIAIDEFDIDIIELGVDFDIPEEPKELTAPHKNEPPTIKLTFSSLKQLERFEIEIKKLIELEVFSNITYSISQGEI